VTLPSERANALRNTREFLRSLLDRSATPRVPQKVRTAAYYCLKHFPGDFDIEQSQEALPEVWGNLEFVAKMIMCKECKGTGKPTRKHSDLAQECEDCQGTGTRKEKKSKTRKSK
jgi:hypothetical protein